MGTLSSEINDLFLMRVTDYRLDTIYNTSGSFVLNEYLEPWLMDAIVEFNECDQVLTYAPTSGTTEGSFSVVLSTENKIILSQIMVKYWMAKSISDVLQMQNFITDRDFKTFSSAQNLQAKKEYYIMKTEEISQLLNNYGFRKLDWVDWQNQDFDHRAV